MEIEVTFHLSQDHLSQDYKNYSQLKKNTEKPLRACTIKEYPLLPLLFNIVIEVLATEISHLE